MDYERRKDPDLLSDINARLAIVESDLVKMSGTRKWLIGIVLGLLVQAVSAGIGYGKLIQRVDSLHLGDLEMNVSTALSVLKDHGGEFAGIREDAARNSGRIDNLIEQNFELRNLIAESTKERFYHRDGDRLEVRIKRIEDHMLEKKRQ